MKSYLVTYKTKQFYTVSREFWEDVELGKILPEYFPEKHYVGPNTRPWVVSKIPVELPLTSININACAYQHDYDYSVNTDEMSDAKQEALRLVADKIFYWNIKANVKNSKVSLVKRTLSYALAYSYYKIVRTFGKKHFGLPSKIK
jgi:hypothetical protein